MDMNAVRELLWERAYEIDARISELRERSDRLFRKRREIQNGPCAPWRVQELEEEYWDVNERIDSLEGLEESLLAALGRIDRGEELSLEEVEKLLPKRAERVKPKKLSKRRRAVERDKRHVPEQSLEELYFGFATLDPVGPPEERRLSTGRHATSVKGRNVSEFDFFAATTDTHGGKSRKSHKKKGGYYTTKSGRRIRKR